MTDYYSKVQETAAWLRQRHGPAPDVAIVLGSGLGEFTAAGNLMSYGPTQQDVYAKLAVYADKVLRGAKPGELPVENPTRFELVFNLKVARALKLKVPQLMLLRADRVIE